MGFDYTFYLAVEKKINKKEKQNTQKKLKDDRPFTVPQNAVPGSLYGWLYKKDDIRITLRRVPTMCFVLYFLMEEMRFSLFFKNHVFLRF